MQDPYFAARNNWLKPVATSYMSDILRTYGKQPKTDTFDRALAFREKEKKQINALVEENDRMRRELTYYNQLHTRAATALKKLSEENTLLKSKHTVNGDSSTRSASTRRVPPDEGADAVQPEALPATDVPGVGGQGGEHADERRSPSPEPSGDGRCAGGGVGEDAQHIRERGE